MSDVDAALKVETSSGSCTAKASNKIFAGGSQQDAQEFIQVRLDMKRGCKVGRDSL